MMKLPPARKCLGALGTALILIGLCGLMLIYQYDHRQAASLSAYAKIDFQSSYTEKGQLEGAVLTLWDSRYDHARLLPRAVLYTDGDAWEMKADVKQAPPPGEAGGGSRFKTENKLFVELPKASLKAIRNADEVRFRYYYDNGQTIDLPLDAHDLEYFKEQLSKGR